MLVRLDEQGALAIGQLSHSWLSGQIARAWGNERFDPPDPFEEVVLGAQQHDIGWALADADPRWSPATGLPANFLETTVEEHLAIWRDAPDRLVSQSVHAALAVSLHGCAISELRARALPEQADELREHIEHERARQAAISAALGLSEDRVRHLQRQMWTWDGLSLALGNRWQPFTARDVPAAEGLVDVELRSLGDSDWTLDPWPLRAEDVELRCEGRRLQARYDTEAAMREAFARAEVVTLTFRLRRTAAA